MVCHCVSFRAGTFSLSPKLSFMDGNLISVGLDLSILAGSLLFL